jgi:hypothetical protein
MRRVYYGWEGESDESDESRTDRGAPASLPIPSPWPIPAGLNAVLVDRKSGKLASQWCEASDQYVEYYVPGTEPTESCDRAGFFRFRIPGLR